MRHAADIVTKFVSNMHNKLWITTGFLIVFVLSVASQLDADIDEDAIIICTEEQVNAQCADANSGYEIVGVALRSCSMDSARHNNNQTCVENEYLTQLQQRLAFLEEKWKSIDNKLERLEQEVNSTNSRMTGVDHQLDTINNSLSLVNNTVATSVNEIMIINKKITTTENKLETMENKLESINHIIPIINNNVAMNVNQMITINGKIVTMDNKLEKMEEDVNRSDNRLTNFETKLETINNTLSIVNTSVSMDNKLTTISNKLEKIDKELNSTDDRITDIENKLENVNNTLSIVNKSVSTCANDVMTIDNRLTATINDLQTVNQIVSTINDTIATAVNERLGVVPTTQVTTTTAAATTTTTAATTTMSSESSTVEIPMDYEAIRKRLEVAGELGNVTNDGWSKESLFTWKVENIEEEISKAEAYDYYHIIRSLYTDVPGHKMTLYLYPRRQNYNYIIVCSVWVTGMFDKDPGLSKRPSYEIKSIDIFQQQFADNSFTSIHEPVNQVSFLPQPNEGLSRRRCESLNIETDMLISSKDTFIPEGHLSIRVDFQLG